MSRSLVLAALIVTTAAAIQAQSDKTAGVALQFFPTSAGSASGAIRTIQVEGVAAEAVTGKPVSATEERHSLQVLGDGTRIENTQTDQFYRDSQGRTRTERSGGVVIISDPVQGAIYELDTSAKTARRIAAFRRGPGGSGWSVSAPAAKPGESIEQLKAKLRDEAVALQQPLTATAEVGVAMATIRPGPITAKAPEAGKGEDLGMDNVNGVAAEGSRNTITIAPGQIGNDREIKVVSERWYSSDLQMLIKSTNSDPRFGDTSYELTNINRSEPDPSLFTIPSDYTVLSGLAPTK